MGKNEASSVPAPEFLVPEWTPMLRGDTPRLQRAFVFASERSAWAFAAHVGLIASAMDRFPRLLILGRTVEITLGTRAGLAAADEALGEVINAISPRPQG